MNNFVYCDECHLVFFDVSCKKCPQCREGNLREVAVYIEPAAEQPLAPDAATVANLEKHAKALDYLYRTLGESPRW